jgi:nitrile hydratase
VKVRQEDAKTYWRKPHLRTPGYIFGKIGVVERVCGAYTDPTLLAYHTQKTPTHLYRVLDLLLFFSDAQVRFRQKDVWPTYSGDPEDTIDVEIYQSWLDTVTDAERAQCM